MRKRLRRMSPAAIIASSFVLAVIIGGLLLLLPVATTSGHNTTIDAMFTAASAVCVTGLVVVDTGTHYSLFGQIVILLLIQVGGLGVMTISVTIFRMIGRAIPFRQRMLLQDVFAHTPRDDIFRLVKSIFLFTSMVELIGACLLFGFWVHRFPWPHAAYLSVFHAVSAFCNAGFALFPDLSAYRGSLTINITICSLIVFGGIGFPVVFDVYSAITNRKTRRRFTVQTKTVLLTTTILIILGAVLFWAMEFRHSLRDFGIKESLLASLFQSITCRTAGFNTVDIAGLRASTLELMMVLMFFGASPGSTGGGVKTTTLAIMCAFIWNRIKHRGRTNLFKKSIPIDTVNRSFMLILISIGLIAVIHFLLQIDLPVNIDAAVRNQDFLAYLFETVSAFGTVGLSMGVTPGLSIIGKLWIILMMLIGRVGVLTFSYLITGAERGDESFHAEENLMIG